MLHTSYKLIPLSTNAFCFTFINLYKSTEVPFSWNYAPGYVLFLFTNTPVFTLSNHIIFKVRLRFHLDYVLQILVSVLSSHFWKLSFKCPHKRSWFSGTFIRCVKKKDTERMCAECLSCKILHAYTWDIAWWTGSSALHTMITKLVGKVLSVITIFHKAVIKK